MVFVNRVDAGRQLAERLRRYQGPDVVVLGLPRGGVPVAFEVARALGAPLDVIVVRKLGVPYAFVCERSTVAKRAAHTRCALDSPLTADADRVSGRGAILVVSLPSAGRLAAPTLATSSDIREI
jgi:predicted phosphoribosyltransferase